MMRKPYWLLALLVTLTLVLTACPAAAPAATEAPAEAPAAEATEAPAEEAAAEATEAPAEEAAAAPAGECAPAADGALAGIDPSGQAIVWWHNHSGGREEGLLALVDEFNASNPCGITVEAQNQGGYDDIRDKVNASITAGEQPAALIVGYQNDQAFYQLNETLADFNTYIDDPTWGLSEEDKADFYASFFDQSVHVLFDNQRLGFPPNRSMEVLYYNATWLQELGYDGPPTTPEEFKEMACAAAQSNDSKGYLLRDDASAVAAWTYAFGGDVLSEDGTAYVYNSQATVDALTLLKSMFDEGCAGFLDDPQAFPNTEFAARKAIFAQGSSSGIPFYAGDVATAAEEAGKTADEWGVAPIPYTGENPVQNIYGGDVMVTATTPEQQLAAWLFVKWFTSPETQAKWVVASNYFPTRASATEFLGDYLAENTQWTQAVELLPFAYYEPQLISYTGVRDAATQAFNEIIQGADIQATLDQLTEDANAMQEELMAEVQ